MLTVSEGLISLSQAAKRIPSTRGDRTVHPATIWRWAKHGYRLPGGRVVKLEIVRIGYGYATTEAALDRFIHAMTNPEPIDETDEKPKRRSSFADQRRRAAKAAEELKRMGA